MNEMELKTISAKLTILVKYIIKCHYDIYILTDSKMVVINKRIKYCFNSFNF
jgi:hypothetical protein